MGNAVGKHKEKDLDENYTSVLRAVLNKFCELKPYETAAWRPPSSYLPNQHRRPAKSNRG